MFSSFFRLFYLEIRVGASTSLSLFFDYNPSFEYVCRVFQYYYIGISVGCLNLNLVWEHILNYVWGRGARALGWGGVAVAES